MPKGFRDPQTIQEELDDLRAIIENEEKLISQHPEHKELPLIHADSKKREEELIGELKASLKKPAIIYTLEDDTSSPSNAPAQLLGNILVAMQKLIFSIAGASVIGGRRSAKEEQLYLLNVKFAQGSVVMEFSPALLEPTFEDIMTQTPVFDRASKFLCILPQRGLLDDQLKLEVKKQIDDPRARIATLNSLSRLIPPPGKKAEIKFKNINGNTPKIELHDDLLKRRIESLLKEEIEKNDVEVCGVITRIKIDKPDPFFSVKDWQGKVVKVQMPDDMIDEIFNLSQHLVPIKLSGVGNKRKSQKIDELDKIEQNKRIVIDSIHGIKFKSPIVAQLSYESCEGEDYWVVGSDEFGAFGVDSTVPKAKEMFEEDLYSAYIDYKDLSNSKLTDKAMSLKKKLIHLFEEK